MPPVTHRVAATKAAMPLVWVNPRPSASIPA